MTNTEQPPLNDQLELNGSTNRYVKHVNMEQLRREIEASFIVTGELSLSSDDLEVIVSTSETLTEQEKVMLDSIIEQHNPNFTEQPREVQLAQRTNEDGIPYVYSTSKPLNHYVSFQGADDRQYSPDHDHLPHFSRHEVMGVGMGKKLTFLVKSTDKKVTKDFMFNENVYVKDGYMITQNSPFGACFDIDIIHPQLGLLFPFGKKVPVMGTGWFPMDTEDRGFIPKGLIIRITVYNSQFDDADEDAKAEEEPPATFRMAGRFELYRPKPPGT